MRVLKAKVYGKVQGVWFRKFKQWLKTGSPNSRVDKIDYSWEDSPVKYLTFEIEY